MTPFTNPVEFVIVPITDRDNSGDEFGDQPDVPAVTWTELVASSEGPCGRDDRSRRGVGASHSDEADGPAWHRASAELLGHLGKFASQVSEFVQDPRIRAVEAQAEFEQELARCVETLDDFPGLRANVKRTLIDADDGSRSIALEEHVERFDSVIEQLSKFEQRLGRDAAALQEKVAAVLAREAAKKVARQGDESQPQVQPDVPENSPGHAPPRSIDLQRSSLRRRLSPSPTSGGKIDVEGMASLIKRVTNAQK